MTRWMIGNQTGLTMFIAIVSPPKKNEAFCNVRRCGDIEETTRALPSLEDFMGAYFGLKWWEAGDDKVDFRKRGQINIRRRWQGANDGVSL